MLRGNRVVNPEGPGGTNRENVTRYFPQLVHLPKFSRSWFIYPNFPAVHLPKFCDATAQGGTECVPLLVQLIQ
jgi:hypothetical protein